MSALNRSFVAGCGALVLVLLIVAGCRSSQPSGASADDSAASPDDVVLARYADSTITVGQFERRYRRTVGPENGSDPGDASGVDTSSAPVSASGAASRRGPAAPDSVAGDSMAAYRDFLNRYLDFRLKVEAARDAGMDTLSSLQQEVASYRRQTARPTLMKREVVEPVVREVYERQQEEIRARHLLIRVSEDAPPSDTIEAYRTIQSLVDSLERGTEFGALAERHSDDPSAQQEGQRGYRGDLGYITAGQVVEPFEAAMYNTPVDSLSDVFRTRFGYHVLTVEDRRPRMQPVRLSHILLRPENSTAADTAEARRLADSLRTALNRGADFARLAREFSADRRSAQRGGDLGTVQPGQSLPEAFRAAVAELDTGDVSDVVETRFGYHLIKLTERTDRPTFEEAYDDLKQQVSRLPRIEKQERQLAQQVRREHGAMVDTTRLFDATGASSADTLARVLLPPPTHADTASMGVASMGDSTYTVGQLARYVAQTEGAAQQPLSAVIDDFLNARALDYAAARLEERDPDFSAQLREYREGLLLFQFMQDSVWTKAAQDTVLLRKTYRRHQDRYRFPERVRTVVLRAPADTLLQPYLDRLTGSDDALSALATEARTDSLVRVDTAYVTDRSPDLYRPVLSAADGSVHGPVDDEGERVVLVRDRQLPARPKSFDEARSAVVRDAQDAYEETVVDRLRRRYDAELYPDRLRYVFADDS